MIESRDVDLIIFDMDGTIIPSLAIIYAGIQSVFDDYGWELRHTAEDINRYIGTAAGELYRGITPPEYADKWQEVRERTREKYHSLYRERAETYPGVKETLAELHRRGYTLVQYSNASVTYFDLVLSSLDIRNYYDYTECVHENGLTKIELISKIREKFGNPGTAVIGDRIHDIEAARANDSLSIGALYGYGNDEPLEADLTISSFTGLQDLFDRRLPMFDHIFSSIDDRKQPDRAFVIGINGIDCSGKTKFAEGFECYLHRQGRNVQIIHLDEFLNNRDVRYSGDYHDNRFYERVKQGYQYNYPFLVKGLLEPVRRDGSLQTRLTLLDWKTDACNIEREFIITTDTIIILEGIFLFIDTISPWIDLQVFLEVPFDECLKRARERDPAEVFRNYEKKYLPAQRTYLAEYPPHLHADIIIENTDWNRPHIVST